MATYTTATLVRLRAENIDATLTDANIEDYIEDAEQILNAIMGVSFLASFDATKHGILRAAANAWATMCAVTYNPAGFTTLNEAQTIVETLAYQWEFCTTALENKTLVAYLESL